MKTRKLLALLMALCMVFALVAACGGGDDDASTPSNDPTPSGSNDPTPSGGDDGQAGGDDGQGGEDENVIQLPREETLYFGGLGWQAIKGWSPLMSDTANWANDQNAGGARTMVFETAYMYNALDNKAYPLLADGDFSWNADFTELTYKIKPAAKWSDGTKVTAHDAQATWDTKLNHTVGACGNWLPYVSGVVALDDETVLVTATLDDSGIPVYPTKVEEFLVTDYILQKAWLDTLVERNGGDPAEIDVDPGEDFVASGPYTRFFEDDTRAVLVRDDNYWGQDASMWGKLPAPKYLVNTILNDNNAIRAAFAAGELDVSQAFLPDVHKLWEDDGLPVSTFYQDRPYHLSANMPTIHFNLRDEAKPVLKEVELRQAIAWATDYDAINANAVTYQSLTFAEVPRSLFNPSAGEQALYDQSAVAHLQWVGNDIDGANALLDGSGKFPMGDDGWRTYEGEKISLNAACPSGWSDWEATIEVVAAAGEKIGIEITSYFPSEGEFYHHVPGSWTSGELDIFMMWSSSFAPTGAWGRIRNMLHSDMCDPEIYPAWTNWSGNWNAYRNPEADALIDAIPQETDPAKLTELYTKLVEIYLTDVPSFSAMYRPDKFHTVYEGVWTGYTEQGDGRNVPPFNCISGYAIADLYNLTLVG